jgi:glycosyltransferase involved in cell wall biosynthesis
LIGIKSTMVKSKTKVLFLNYEFPPLGGGAGNATKYLFLEFAKNSRLEIDLISSSTDKFKVKNFSKNIKIHYLDINKKGNIHYQSNKDLLKYSWQAYRYAKRLMRKKKFNLVHAFFGIPCGYIAMKLGLPYIVSLRGSDVPFYNSRFAKLDKLIFQRLSRRVWQKADAVVANSGDLQKLAKKTFSGEIVIIPNGVDTKEFRPKKNSRPSSKIKLVSTGRLISRKGYQYLIPALKGLKNIDLTLVGGGDLRNELEELAKKNKVEINFIGEVGHNKIVNYLQNADIFILPSLNEGMSNSILEAMACGLPIITTDTGGSKELIDGNGFIIKKRSASSIKKVLEKYLKSRQLIRKQGRKSRVIAEYLSWKNVASNYKRIYDQLA